jgi:hypothetical protein
MFSSPIPPSPHPPVSLSEPLLTSEDEENPAAPPPPLSSIPQTPGAWFPEASESYDCRICGNGRTAKADPLISPCQCTGYVHLVHTTCLHRWIELRPEDATLVELAASNKKNREGDSLGSLGWLDLSSAQKGQIERVNAQQSSSSSSSSSSAADKKKEKKKKQKIKKPQSKSGKKSIAETEAPAPLTPIQLILLEQSSNPRLICEICRSPYRISLKHRFTFSRAKTCSFKALGLLCEGFILLICMTCSLVLTFMVGPDLNSSDNDDPSQDDDPHSERDTNLTPQITLWVIFGIIIIMSFLALKKICGRFLEASSITSITSLDGQVGGLSSSFNNSTGDTSSAASDAGEIIIEEGNNPLLADQGTLILDSTRMSNPFFASEV